MIASPAYAELHCHSYFSLLDGASAPEALVTEAKRLGLSALALTDHDSLAGAVRFWRAAQQQGLQPLFGAEVTLTGNQHLTLLAETQQGYGKLCRLISAARLDYLPREDDDPWPGKVAPALTWERLAQHAAGLIALTGCNSGPVAAPLRNGDESGAREALGALRDIFGAARLYVELQHHALPGDDRQVAALQRLAQAYKIPVVATGNVHYANREGSRLRDALIAIHHNLSLTEARQAGYLPGSSHFALASPQAMARRFAETPQALQNTLEIAARCQVSLDFSGKRLPRFPTPAGQSEFALLYQHCHARLPVRYPELRPRVLTQLAHELDVIERAGLAGYFLIVWDIMRFARSEGIRCQGRGSAANSIVAYLLGITSIDPLAHELLFERFLSEDKFTMPDIDIDFAADRREEVIRYVYARYGKAHTAMVCNLVTYRARSAIRDLGKALALPDQVIDRLAKQVDGYSPVAAARQIAAELEPETPPHHPLRLLAGLMAQIEGCPRHLSIHSGGMLITGPPLHEIVPLEPATMPGRVICQWDKDSVEDAGLIKLDLLSLRTLGLISEAETLIRQSGAVPPDLDRLPLDDPALYRMLARGDTIGAFQVESRAQQQMLPRLKPHCFEDIAVEIAIVRPGPIQGGAVHPYLRRRTGQEEVAYLHPLLEPVLRETLGVLLFQEQAIRLAVVVAGFAPGEADLLRRALSRNRAEAELATMRARFVRGAAEQGVDEAIAEAIFAQLAGFAGYGFCKSHAMSFALIAWQTLWLKRYHPVAFTCALLNQQPMGFYSPEVVIQDAIRHGVTMLPVSVQQSRWRYTLEADEKKNGMSARASCGQGRRVGKRLHSGLRRTSSGNSRI
ncbi:MAG: DNA polymerase III subunit alpha [Caldilineaceae bacterium]